MGGARLLKDPLSSLRTRNALSKHFKAFSRPSRLMAAGGRDSRHARLHQARKTQNAGAQSFKSPRKRTKTDEKSEKMSKTHGFQGPALLLGLLAALGRRVQLRQDLLQILGRPFEDLLRQFEGPRGRISMEIE